LAYRPWLVSEGSLVFEADSNWSSKYKDDRELILNAPQQGAVAAVVAKPIDEKNFKLPYLLVNDTFEAYETLAKASRQEYQGKIIGITGSVGKTTTKEMLKTILSTNALVYASHNKLNNYRGLVNNIAQCTPNVDYSIYEFGMAKIGSIANKSLLAKPHIAIITDIQPDHLKHHKNIKSIARTKAEIFTGMDKDGIAILNRDNEYYNYLKKKARSNGISHIVSFGRRKTATIRLLNTRLSNQGSKVRIRVNQQELEYHLGAIGMSSVYNSLAAFAAVYALGLPLPIFINTLENFTAPEQRGEQLNLKVNHKNIIVIDQRYNSNIASLKACADNLVIMGKTPQIPHKTTFILGDMEQLGKFASELHEQAGKHLANCDIDQILFFGEYSKELQKGMNNKSNLICFDSPDKLYNYFLEHLKENEIMTIKGSWSNDEFDNIIKSLRQLEYKETH